MRTTYLRVADAAGWGAGDRDTTAAVGVLDCHPRGYRNSKSTGNQCEDARKLIALKNRVWLAHPTSTSS
jgi:hypothetical protein